MTQIRRGINWIGRGLVAGVMMATAWSAHAASTWNFGSNNDPAAECIPSEVTASGGCKASSGDALYVKGTGYTSASGAFAATTIEAWDGSGLGVGGEGNPQHSVDNVNGVELIALDFKGSSVALKSISFGWTYNNEADFSIFRWVGASAPTSTAITGKTESTLKNDASGWQLVGNWAGDTAGDYNLGISDSTTSSWWLVSAYSDSYGGTCNTTYASSCGGSNDYFKLLTVTANVKTGGGGGKAPEPGSLALVGMALAGVLAVQRRREQPTPKG